MRAKSPPPDLTGLAAVMQRYAGIDPTAVLLDEQTAAACVEQRPKTLESWRRKAIGPRFLKLGRGVRYRLSDVLAFLEDSTFQSQREAMTRNPRGAA
ncbi:MAG: hypothetical protein ACK2U9_03280 [Anaerolineae bacterium]